MKAQSRKKRNLLLAGAASLLLITTATADDLNTQAQKMFNDLGAVGNLTPPQAFKGQTLNTYTGGSLYIRTPTKNYQLSQMQLPYVKAGCGGIDAFGGSFSHISSAQFKQMLKNITSAVPGVLFQMMIDSVEPLLGGEMKWFKGIEQMVNQGHINSCNAAKSIASFMDQETGISQKACETAALLNNNAADAASARELCKNAADLRNIMAQAKANPNTKDIVPFSGNLVWEMLKKSNPGLDQDDLELIMSMTGTTIYSDVDDNAPAPLPIAPTIKNISDLLYGNTSTSSSSSPGLIQIDMVRCPSRNYDDPCLIDPNAPRTTVTMQALSERVRQLMQSISDKIANRSGVPTAEEQSFVNAVPLPVYKLLSTSTAINSSAVSDAKIGQYADYVAVEFAYGLLSRAASLGASGTGYIGAKLSPPQVQQLAIHREQAKLLMRSLDNDRMAAYQKAGEFLAVAQDIEMLQRNLKQNMSQQMTDLMAFSTTGKRW